MIMTLAQVIALFGLVCYISCMLEQQSQSEGETSIDQLYEQTKEKVKRQQYDSAITLLQRGLDFGFDWPMYIVTDSNLVVLVDHPGSRPKIRMMLQEHASGHHAPMVRSSEMGESIRVKGVIVDEQTQQPIPDVQIELVQADANGLYFPEQSTWNPRIFAYLVTNEVGEFSVSTIRPGKYEDDDGATVPAHIHFTLNKDGYRVFGSEFTFEDDSLIMAKGNLDQVPVAILEPGSMSKYFVRIPMQKDD